MSKQETETVEASLKPDLYRRFLKVKERYGNISNANVLRVLISAEYHRIQEEEQARREYDHWIKLHQKA